MTKHHLAERTTKPVGQYQHRTLKANIIGQLFITILLTTTNDNNYE